MSALGHFQTSSRTTDMSPWPKKAGTARPTERKTAYRLVLAHAVAVVDVVAELHDAIRRCPGRHVNPVKRQRLCHLGILALAGFDHVVDLGLRPARRFRQNPVDEFADILHAHAA